MGMMAVIFFFFCEDQRASCPRLEVSPLRDLVNLPAV